MDAEQEERRNGGNRGKIEWKLSEVNTGAVSRDKNELVGKFKMPMGDVISKVMKYTHIPTGIKRELVKFGMNWDRNR